MAVWRHEPGSRRGYGPSSAAQRRALSPVSVGGWDTRGVARTGRRAAALRRILVEAGLQPLAGQLPRPTGAEHRDELLDVYRALGGRIEAPVWQAGPWDIVLEGPLLVELDEQLH